MTSEERAEYEGYIRANKFVAVLQAKARKMLAAAEHDGRSHAFFGSDSCRGEVQILPTCSIAIATGGAPDRGYYSAEAPGKFHPRRNHWELHFRWHGIHIEGMTAVGRTTVEVMQMNSQDRLELRAAGARSIQP